MRGWLRVELEASSPGLLAATSNVAIGPCAAVDECSGIIPSPPQAASSCNCENPDTTALTQFCMGFPSDVNCSVAPNCYATGWGAYAQRENHSYTIEEGFADWVSASVWNDRTQDQGTFTLFGRAHDLRYYNEGAGTNAGGHARNECAAVSGTNPSFVGHSTREDFQRMLWRWRGNQVIPCPELITVQDVFNVYRGIRDLPTVAVGDNWPWIDEAVLQYKPAYRWQLQGIAWGHGVKN